MARRAARTCGCLGLFGGRRWSSRVASSSLIVSATVQVPLDVALCHRMLETTSSMMRAIVRCVAASSSSASVGTEKSTVIPSGDSSVCVSAIVAEIGASGGSASNTGLGTPSLGRRCRTSARSRRVQCAWAKDVLVRAHALLRTSESVLNSVAMSCIDAADSWWETRSWSSRNRSSRSRFKPRADRRLLVLGRAMCGRAVNGDARR